MNQRDKSGYECFDELIALLKAEGRAEEGQRIHTLLHEVAWTTSSELLGELGQETLAIQRSNPACSVELHCKFTECLKLVRRVWPTLGG
jgi:hypothetical protein